MTEINLSEKILKLSGKEAIVGPLKRLSWQDFLKRVTVTARALQNLGISKDDRVAVLSDINQEFPILLFALLKRGAVLLPLRPDLPDVMLRKYTAAAGCRFLLLSDETRRSSIGFPVMPITYQRLSEAVLEITSAPEPAQKSELRFSAEQPATILFTSGSSGEPKGIIHTIGNHYFSALGANQNMPLSVRDRWLIVLPFFHVSGISILFRTLIAGAASVIADKKQDLSAQLSRHKITHLSLVPLQLQRLLEEGSEGRKFPALKAVLTGGSQCPPALTRRALKAGLPLYLSYGSTEMASQIATAGPEELLRNPLSSGLPLPYRKVKIGKDNEIMVGGATLGKPLDKCRKSSVTRGAGDLYPSGDTGRFDEKGSLTVTGRLDNMFISGGENIYPEEIEHALLDLDEITAACVVSVPDNNFGAKPVAFVTMRPGQVIRENILRTKLEKVLPRFKIPVRFLDWKPEKGQLKPDRVTLHKQAMNCL